MMPKSMHETVCSDAAKLAEEICNDVWASEGEVAAAIAAGFRFREKRLAAVKKASAAFLAAWDAGKRGMHLDKYVRAIREALREAP